jgi:hypothetical protein
VTRGRVQTQTRLALLGELEALHATARIRAWLRAGWAPDFLLGAVTRPPAPRRRRPGHRGAAPRRACERVGLRDLRTVPVPERVMTTFTYDLILTREDHGRVQQAGGERPAWGRDVWRPA